MWPRRELSTGQWEFERHATAGGSAMDVIDSQIPSILSHFRNVKVYKLYIFEDEKYKPQVLT